MKHFLSILMLCLFYLNAGFCQDENKAWDVNDPEGDWNWKEVSFETSEGTWMNLDVSPDGKTIVFDMLGDLYTMSTSGGKATAIRQGVAWEVQPRFSPDGNKILFTSDVGGGDNCWSMDVNGENANQITKEDFRLLNNGVWMPSGDYIVARKHFTSGRSLGAGEMWMYHKTGGSGVQLTKRKNDQQDVNEPCISPDGKFLYFSEDMYPGGYFQYNKDPNSQIYVIKKYDFEKGKTSTLISGPGGAFRPQVSNDGKKLAFIKRIRTKTVLCILDLETGQEYAIYDGLSKDQSEAWAIFGVYPGFDWMPDDKELIISGLGKIWRVDAKSGAATEVPFTAKVDTKVAETIQVKNDAHQDKFSAKVLRGLKTSPDGNNLVFNAVGYLWQRNVGDKKATRLTNGQDFEFEPSFSPDGNAIVYVTWDDERMGEVRWMDLRTKESKVLTDKPGIYRTPSFSPDGNSVVYRKDGGNGHQGYVHCIDPGIYLVSDLSKAESKFLSASGSDPVFSQDGKRIFCQTGGYIFGSLTKSFDSFDLNGQDRKTHFDGKYAQKYVISPDNKWVAWSELYKVFIAPFPSVGQKIGLTSSTKAVPVAQVAKDAGINIHWSKDSDQLYWTLGNEYFSDKLTERFKFLEGAVDSIPPMDSTGLVIDVEIEADVPNTKVLFTNARVITMEGDQVIENGMVLVENNIIKKVAKSIKTPNDAKVVDCQGKTIMPGIMDVHAHSGNFRYGLSPQKQWEYYANLAYGVTTSHDPSANSEMVFAQSELIKAGKMIGPRLFSTGTILYGADGDFKALVNNLDDA